MDTLTRFFQTTLQLAVVGLVWLVSDLMVRFAHLPVSSGVLGLFLMLALLCSGVIKTGMVERGAKWVLGELVFFFIPIMVSVLQYRDLLISEGLAAGADDCGRHRAGDDQHGVDAEFLLPLETPPV